LQSVILLMNSGRAFGKTIRGTLGCSLILSALLAFQVPIAARAQINSDSLKPGENMPPMAPSLQTMRQNQARAMLQQGMEKHASGQSLEAEQLFHSAAALDPSNADSFFNLGALAEGRGDLVSALSNYRAALHIKPNEEELKQAVTSIEQQLSRAQAGSTQNGHHTASSSNVSLKSNHAIKPAPPIPHDATTFSVSPSAQRPLEATISQDSLKANSLMNDTTAIDTTPKSDPTFAVATKKRAPLLNVSPRTRSTASIATRAALGVILSVGAGYAGAGALHCPICRLLRGF
jgi:tetratricopeptide (TPR) repeat protein